MALVNAGGTRSLATRNGVLGPGLARCESMQYTSSASRSLAPGAIVNCSARCRPPALNTWKGPTAPSRCGASLAFPCGTKYSPLAVNSCGSSDGFLTSTVMAPLVLPAYCTMRMTSPLGFCPFTAGTLSKRSAAIAEANDDAQTPTQP